MCSVALGLRPIHPLSSFFCFAGLTWRASPQSAGLTLPLRPCTTPPLIRCTDLKGDSLCGAPPLSDAPTAAFHPFGTRSSSRSHPLWTSTPPLVACLAYHLLCSIQARRVPYGHSVLWLRWSGSSQPSSLPGTRCALGQACPAHASPSASPCTRLLLVALPRGHPCRHFAVATALPDCVRPATQGGART